MPLERVSSAQKQTVFARAIGCCEYCQTPDIFVPGSFAVEHIVPKSKGGKTVLGNLALSCPACNAHKYNKLSGRDPVSGKPVRLFNPRRQRWPDHFAWSDDLTLVVGLTRTGRATVEALRNQERMIRLRRLLILASLHPAAKSIKPSSR